MDTALSVSMHTSQQCRKLDAMGPGNDEKMKPESLHRISADVVQ
jgi:hypothetical protein